MKVQVSNANTPVWRDITVESRMPAQLNILQEMARNIWWVWNNEALSMFKSIDPEIWKAVNGNPVMLLNRVSYERLEEIVADKSMMYTINAQYEKFRKYIDEKPKGNLPSVAYFSMEYGLANVLKIYSGGLGILARISTSFPSNRLSMKTDTPLYSKFLIPAASYMPIFGA